MIEPSVAIGCRTGSESVGRSATVSRTIRSATTRTPSPTTTNGSVSVRYWSILFALAAIFSVGAFVYAPFSPDWWLPNPPGDHLHVVSTFGREIDSLFLIILWITGIVFIGTQIVLVWAALPVRGRARCPGPAGPPGRVLPRQPAARGDLDDHPGRHPGLHRPLPDGDLGRDQVPQRGPEGPAAGGDHRPAVPVGDALSRARRQAATPATTCSPSTTCISSRTSTALDLSEVVGRAPFVLPAAAADQAGRRARA